MALTRRSVLRGLGGVAALHLAGLPGRAWASAGRDPRLVVVLLRGGLDGLAAVPAVGDPHWSSARAGLGGPAVGEAGGPFALDDLFALDARLATLRELYGQGELLVAHAVALPYRDRSHFDAQNLLESGGTRPFALPHGWLGRALATGRVRGVGLEPVLPLVLRGAEGTTSWSPTSLAAPTPALLERAAALYERDPVLARGLEQSRASGRMVAGEPAARVGDDSFPALAAAAGAFLTHPDGARVAVLELGGFDSHSLQALSQGRLDRTLRTFDAGMAALRARLGETWQQTVVVASTEFGRTVAMNGSGGTDHGTASVAFLLGGAVAGGRVLADWPGLAPKSLHESRDLRPTRDVRSLWKGVLRDHLQIAEGPLGRNVFPGTEGLPPLDALVRG